VLQRQGGRIVGGSTYEVRLRRARAVRPVSRIRITLERIRVLDDHDPWLKERGEIRLGACVAFNDDPHRRHVVHLPQRGTMKVGSGGSLEVHATLFDGYVAESDNMTLTVAPVEQDWLDADDALRVYRRHFNGPPERWVGAVGPDDDASGGGERLSDWMLWYRVESLPI
jgi:hypothetical protein